MISWWNKFLRRQPLRITSRRRPGCAWQLDHYHIITIFGYELAILKLNN